MIGRCSFDSQHGDPTGILRMLAVLISDTQAMIKATTQLRDTNGKNEPEKTTKMYFTIILKTVLHKEYRKGIIEIWSESSRLNTSQRFADQTKMILKKFCFSEFEIRKI